jgi:hypothetical protein
LNGTVENHRSCRIRKRHHRVTLSIKKEDVEPSDEFRNDVEGALNLSNQKEKSDMLNKLCQKYGYFWARTIHLGGMIIRTEEEDEKSNRQSSGKAKGIEASLGISPLRTKGEVHRNNNVLIQNSSRNSDMNIKVIGGDEKTYWSSDTGTKSL